jgi:AcrR family transcriptional regulator
MSTAADASAVDRRGRRRLQTIEEILQVAVAVMAEHGAGGLSLGEVARRMGMRTPSLYGYFDSKNAVYDAVFARGWSRLNDVLAPFVARIEHDDPDQVRREAAEAFVRWAVEHPAYSQLLFWRPVPGWQPSPDAYGPAVEAVRASEQVFATMQRRGALRAEVDLDEAVAVWTVLISGVVSQQLSNAPDEPYDQGRFTRLLPRLIDMYLSHYGPRGDDHDRAVPTATRSGDPADRPSRSGRRRDGAVRRTADPAARPRRR